MKRVFIGVVIVLSVLVGIWLLVRQRQPSHIEVVSRNGTLRAMLEDGRTLIRVRETATGKELFVLRTREKVHGIQFVVKPCGVCLHCRLEYSRHLSRPLMKLVRPDPEFHPAEPGPQA